MFKCLQIMTCAKYYELRYMFFVLLKNCTSSKLARFLDTRQNSRYFRCPVWKTKSW